MSVIPDGVLRDLQAIHQESHRLQAAGSPVGESLVNAVQSVVGDVPYDEVLLKDGDRLADDETGRWLCALGEFSIDFTEALYAKHGYVWSDETEQYIKREDQTNDQ